jgi:hypothetical protein
LQYFCFLFLSNQTIEDIYFNLKGKEDHNFIQRRSILFLIYSFSRLEIFKKFGIKFSTVIFDDIYNLSEFKIWHSILRTVYF